MCLVARIARITRSDICYQPRGIFRVEYLINDCITQILKSARYDIQTEEWAPIAPMKRARLETACVVFERSICVIGGRNGGQYHKTVEQYSPDTNQWSFLRDMHQKDIALDMHRKRARDRDVLVPRKRINTGDMRQRRTNCGAGVFNKSIYVFGGFNGLGLNSIEKYDSQLQRWFKVRIKQTCYRA